MDQALCCERFKPGGWNIASSNKSPQFDWFRQHLLAFFSGLRLSKLSTHRIEPTAAEYPGSGPVKSGIRVVIRFSFPSRRVDELGSVSARTLVSDRGDGSTTICSS